MMSSWWSKHVGVILSVLVCDIWINVLLQTSALVGPLYIVYYELIMETYIMSLIMETYIMSLIMETYIMSLIMETYIMSLIMETYIMSLIMETYIMSLIHFVKMCWTYKHSAPPLSVAWYCKLFCSITVSTFDCTWRADKPTG
jgi:hypothetical protein